MRLHKITCSWNQVFPLVQRASALPLTFNFWKRKDTISNCFSIKSANRALLESNVLWTGKQTGATSQDYCPGAARAAPPSEREPGKTWRGRAAQSIWKKKGKSRLETVHFFSFKKQKSQRHLRTRNCRHVCFSCTHQTNLGTGSTVDPGQRWRF